jgi:hypothetical protein
VQLRRRLEELREERKKARRRPLPLQTGRAASPSPPAAAARGFYLPPRASQPTAPLPAFISVVPEAAAAESEKATQTSAVFVAVSVKEEEEAAPRTAEQSGSTSGGSEDAERRELELSVERDMADVIRMLRQRLEQPQQHQPPPATEPETERAEATEQQEKEEEEAADEVEAEAVEHHHEHRYIASTVTTATDSSFVSPAVSSPAPAATEAAEDAADMLRRHALALAAIRQRAPRIRQRLTDMATQQPSSRQ